MRGMLPADPSPKVRGLVGRALTSPGSLLPYNRLSDMGGAFIALGLLAPLLIIAGQTARWFHKGVWPTEQMSLLWSALGLPRPSGPLVGLRTVLELLLAVPLWFGVMCLLVAAGYGFKMAASVLRR